MEFIQSPISHSVSSSLATSSPSSIGEILVVDDTPANLRLLVQLLTEQGYKPRPCPNGKLAIAGVQLSIPDLILLDINMPDLNGYEVCQQLKANPKTCQIPVIFISALGETLDKVKAFGVGGVDYITKPFQAEEVLARVSIHLQIHHLQRQLEKTNSEQAKQLAEQNIQLQEINRALMQANQTLSVQYEKLQQSQLQIVQTEKMASLGNLVAGIAHEVNNPIGFLNGSINNAKDYVQDLLGHLALYQEHYPHPSIPIQDHAENIDLELVSADLPKLLDSMQGATDRIKGISTSLRTFSRADTDRPVACNIHDGIDSTIMILKHRLKANEIRPEISVIKDYGDLPQVECYAGQLNQVFMNLLANAIDAVKELNQGRSFAEIKANPNQILIKTELLGDRVVVRIHDNGMGMTEEVKQRIFDHLFTTKGVGKGTGLGLAIARQIVTEKHNGILEVESKLGQGSEFAIVLPVKFGAIMGSKQK